MGDQLNQPLTFVDCSKEDNVSKQDVKRKIRSAAALSGWDGHFKRQASSQSAENSSFSTQFEIAYHLQSTCQSEQYNQSPALRHGGVVKHSNPNRKKRRFNRDVNRRAFFPPVELSVAVEQNLGCRSDPFECYPVPSQPWFMWAMHHVSTVVAPRGWPAVGLNETQGRSWEKYSVQHALEEPASFYLRLLFGTNDLVARGLMGLNISLWLRTQTIAAINEAIRDPRRATSNALILAVGRIAMHECLYGDRRAANLVHRPAQLRMIEARGGFQALDIPPLVKDLMCLCDRVMAVSSGTKPMLVVERKPRHALKNGKTVFQQVKDYGPEPIEDD